MKKILVLLALVIMGCKARYKPPTPQEIEENKRLYECYTKWKRVDLKGIKMVKVLYFGEYFEFDLLTYPNLIIGVDENKDTIIALDNTPFTPYKYRSGETALLLQTYWFDVEKNGVGIAVHKETQKKYYCSIKTLYYARFGWKKFSGRIDTLLER